MYPDLPEDDFNTDGSDLELRLNVMKLESAQKQTIEKLEASLSVVRKLNTEAGLPGAPSKNPSKAATVPGNSPVQRDGYDGGIQTPTDEQPKPSLTTRINDLQNLLK